MINVTLLTITTVIDDDTGIYIDDTGIYMIGELDFGKTGYCEKYLKEGDNREKFVEWLRWLADAAENGESPFSPYKGTADKPLYKLGEQAHQEIAK